MSQRNLFLALPEDLYAEAHEIARLRQISISDLLIEALSETIETQHRRDRATEKTPPAVNGPVRVH